MAMDYDAVARAGGFSKGRPRTILSAEATAAWQAIDKRESAKVRQRSGGRCEVTVGRVRCQRRAFEVHHHQGGIGVRGRGDSALMRHKTHTCSACHHRITGKTLMHISGNAYRERG